MGFKEYLKEALNMAQTAARARPVALRNKETGKFLQLYTNDLGNIDFKTLRNQEMEWMDRAKFSTEAQILAVIVELFLDDNQVESLGILNQSDINQKADEIIAIADEKGLELVDRNEYQDQIGHGHPSALDTASPSLGIEKGGFRKANKKGSD